MTIKNPGGKVVYTAETVDYEIVEGEMVHTYRYFEDTKGAESLILMHGEREFRRFNKEDPREIEMIKLIADEIHGWDWDEEVDGNFSQVLRFF